MKKEHGFMPFYASDYLRDTMHLPTIEHGAYILLITHAWLHDGLLPADSERRRAVTRMDTKQWRRSEATLMAFFTEVEGGFRHGRIDRELTIAKGIIEQKSMAGKASAAKRWGNGKDNGAVTAVITAGVTAAQRLDAPCTKNIESVQLIKDSLPRAYARPPVAAGRLVDDPDITFSEKEGRIFMGRWVIDKIVGMVEDAARIDRVRWQGHGVETQVKTWLRSGYDLNETILPTIKRVADWKDYKVPTSLAYFNKPIAEAHGSQPVSAR